MKIGAHTLTFEAPLSPQEGERLLRALKKTLTQSDKTLGGRGSVILLDDISGKRVAIKPYLRGGLLGKINRATYFGGGPTRAAREADLLKRLIPTAVSAPCPLGIIETGAFARKCWLVMEAIPHDHTLATLNVDDSTLTAIFDALKPQIKVLIEMGIHHVDLHPGNIIITQEMAPVIIDFDKAGEHITDTQNLTQRYIQRWHRAVKKHNLPPSLSHHFDRIMA